MRDEATKHIDESLAKIRVLFEKAAAKIELLPADGKSKIAATALAAEIGKEVGISGPTLYPTLLFMFKNYPGTALRKGAHGGIVRLAPVADAVVADGATDAPVVDSDSDDE